MADASLETIQRLIENSEKGLALLEMSWPQILETRQAVLNKRKEQEDNAVLNLTLVVLDSLLAENVITYDISASLNALLKAKYDYTKRYYMQSLNLCFWEACQLFVGEDGDEDGLLSRLEKLTKELNQSGCQYIYRHIIDDVEEFRKNYTDKTLRDITRHYDNPFKMYERLIEVNSIEYFAKGASQMMAICMELSVVSSYLLNMIVPVKNDFHTVGVAKKLNIKRILNDAMFEELDERNLKNLVEQALSTGQKNIDDCYRLYQNCKRKKEYLESRNYRHLEDFENLESQILLRMETLYLRYDIISSVWGYLNAASDSERSQNLRLIHITKLAALTRIFGYNDNSRSKSLWKKIKAIKESNNESLNTDKVEDLLKEQTSNMDEDCCNSRIYTHYRYKQDFYIPARLEALSKMVHYKELTDSLKLMKVFEVMDEYTKRLLHCMDEKQEQERRRKYDEWTGKMGELMGMAGDNKIVADALKPMQQLIDLLYGDLQS